MDTKQMYDQYLTTHRFPEEISFMQGMNQLIASDYLFDPKLTKQTVNKLTEICNSLLKEKILVLFGDIFLETLQAGLYAFLQVPNLKIQYIDCQAEDLKEYLSNTLTTSSLLKSTILYLCDHFESLSKSVCAYLVEKKQDIQQSNRYIIGLCYDAGKLSSLLFPQFRKLRINTPTDDRFQLQRCVLSVFTESDRTKAIGYLMQSSDWLEYLFTLLTYNLPQFYTNPNIIQHNTNILFFAYQCFKHVSVSKICSLIVTGIILAPKKRAVLFPPKKEKEVKTHEKEK